MLARLGFADASVTELPFGWANLVYRVHRPGEPDVVVKTDADAPAGVYEAEAESLRALATAVRVPEVLDIGPTWLLLEALAPRREDDRFWEAAGRAVAALHAVRGDRYGWQRDGWLGILPQHNTWSDDGHEFFASRRVLRYVTEPRVDALLTQADRRALERLCTRLPSIVPAAPPALTHGDLWHDNVVATAAGEPAFIDPSVSWMWPEVDLSMMYCTGHASARFFDAYLEAHPLPSGWRARMPVLHVRQQLCVLAQVGDRWDTLAQLRETLAPFR